MPITTDRWANIIAGAQRDSFADGVPRLVARGPTAVHRINSTDLKKVFFMHVDIPAADLIAPALIAAI